jgi:hypothetical protein
MLSLICKPSKAICKVFEIICQRSQASINLRSSPRRTSGAAPRGCFVEAIAWSYFFDGITITTISLRMLKNSPRMPQTEWVAALHRSDGCANNRGDNAADGDENTFDAAQKTRRPLAGCTRPVSIGE